MSSYDPKLLESWFRFMAEATRSSAQASDFFSSLSKPKSEEDADELSEMMKKFQLGEVIQAQPETLNAWTEAWWEAMGFVPKARYEKLERQYLALKDRLEEAEREAAKAKRLMAMKGQEDKAKEAVDAWSQVMQNTLEAQTQWWQSWMKQAETSDDKES